MSHFTKVETKINSLTALESAALKLGLRYVAGEAEVRAWDHSMVHAAARIGFPGVRYEAAVVAQEDGEYELVADWSMIAAHSGRNEQDMIDELVREYALSRVLETCAAEGYAVETETVADGSVRLVASKWS